MASFDLLDLGDLPVPQGDTFVCCACKVCEIGPLTGDAEKVRRQIRVSEVAGSDPERALPLRSGSGWSVFVG